MLHLIEGSLLFNVVSAESRVSSNARLASNFMEEPVLDVRSARRCTCIKHARTRAWTYDDSVYAVGFPASNVHFSRRGKLRRARPP